jgi:hypothetical protein
VRSQDWPPRKYRPFLGFFFVQPYGFRGWLCWYRSAMDGRWVIGYRWRGYVRFTR